MLFVGLVFWVPPIASAILLGISWSTGLLRRPWVSAAWFLVAFLGQFWSIPYTLFWAAAIALQVTLGVRLAILWKLAG